MARLARPPQTIDLLCENCGYTLGGLSQAGACPECGRMIGDSLPSGRTGSPWQRSIGLRSWINTVAVVLQHPRTCWREIEVETSRSIALAVVCTGVAGFFALSPASALHWRAGETVDAIMLLLFGVFGGGAILMTLTWIERVGITLFGKRQGWRTTRRVAWAVCGHASVGWLICGALVALGWGLGVVMGGQWVVNTQFGSAVLATPAPSSILVVGAFLVGMVVFESLAYLGFRSMRFANPPEAGANESAVDNELVSAP